MSSEENPSEEELYQIIEELQNRVAELEQENTNLQKGDIGRGRKKGGQSDSALEEEVRQLREKNDEDQATISKLREDLSNSNLKLSKVNEEKNEIDRKFRVAQKRIEDLEKQTDDHLRKSQQAEKQNREVNKLKSENIKITQQLSEENAKLKEDNKELQLQMQKLLVEKQELEEAITTLHEHKVDIEAHRDNLDVALNDHMGRVEELEKDLGDMQDKLQASLEAESDWEKKYHQLEQKLSSAKTQAEVDQKQLKIENEKLQLQIIQLKDSTNLGKVHKEADDLRVELAKAKQVIEELEHTCSEVQYERNALASELMEFNTNLDQKIVDKVTYERSQSKTYELAVDQLKQKISADQDYYRSVEEEKSRLTKEIDELKHWKAVYEAGHGLTNLAKEKKKLQDDNRRLSTEIEKHMNQIGALMDSNNILSLAFEKLKKECGKPANFRYPELELQQEVQSALFSLQFQLSAVEDQLHSIENDNIKLRKQLLENLSRVISEKGFAYPGMTPDMLMKINEFADNIRNGSLQLPLNDKSRELAHENMQLKAEIKALQQYQRKRSVKKTSKLAPSGNKFGAKAAAQSGAIPGELLEAAEEVVGDEESGAGFDYSDSITEGGGGGLVSDVFGADIKTLLSENDLLQRKMSDLQHQLDQLINQQTPTPGLVKTEDLAAIISQNNELILKEIDDVRRSHSNAISQGQWTDRPNEANSRAVQHHASFGSSLQHGQSKPPTGRHVRGGADAATPMRPNSANFTNTPSWTPNVMRVSYQTPGGMTPGPLPAMFSGAGPATPHGKQLLNTALFHMNLPPEEWASEVKDITTHLIECLEQLYEREQDLEVQKTLVKTFEENVAEMKLQMTVLYHDYAQRRKEWNDKEKQILEEQKLLLSERDDLKLRLKRSQDMVILLQKEDKEAIETKLIELTRKVTIYEVNESILSRKYIALQETLETETKRRMEVTNDFIEMESLLKQRILYLEQYKLLSSNRVGLLQTKLDSSIPQEDYLTVELELEALREDHLNALRREVETRINALKGLEREREVRNLKLLLVEFETESTQSRERILRLEQELLHQKDLTSRAINAAKSTAEVSNLVSEMARYRGEASRLEVELLASNQKISLLTTNLTASMNEIDQYSNRVKELEQREQEYSSKESQARAELRSMKLLYEHGCTRDEKEELTQRALQQSQQLEEQQREIRRLQEIADIAQHQAQSLQENKLSFETEIKELRSYCSQLESRSEDELLIGRLQRQLISTKASYKGFVRKYHSTRENLRRREIAMRMIENKLMEVEKSSSEDKERSYVQIAALKRALRNIKDTIVQSTPNLMQTTINTPAAANARYATGGGGGGGPPVGLDGGGKVVSVRANNAFGRNKYYTLGLGAKLVEISEKVETLAELAENSVAKATEKEEESRTLQGTVEDLETERAILLQRLKDLETLTAANPKQQVIAARIMGLSEEVRITKLTSHQQRRQIQSMRDEMKHLRSIVQKMENEVSELEKGKIELEVHKSILFDQSSQNPLLKRSLGDSNDLDLDIYDEEEQLLREIDKVDPNQSIRLSLDDAAGAKAKKKSQTPRIDRNILSPKLQRSLSRLSIDTNNGDTEDKEEILLNLTADEFQAKFKHMSDQLSQIRKENSELRLQHNSLSGQLDNYSHLLSEKDNQLSYYERILQEHGLQQVLLRDRGSGLGLSSANIAFSAQTPHGQHHYRILPEEQEKLQEAASATNNALKQLLEEKSRRIKVLEERLEAETRGPSSSSKSRAERRADDLIEEIDNMSGNVGRGERNHGISGAKGGMTPLKHDHLKSLQDQIDVADQMIQEKDRTMQQLESRLATEINARERAEDRCGDALREIEAMKLDLMTLVQQVHDKNHRMTHLTSSAGEQILSASLRNGAHGESSLQKEDPYDKHVSMEMEDLRREHSKAAKRKSELEKVVKIKEEKLKSYRDIIIRLKEEFIKVEEEKAAQDLLQQRGTGGAKSALDNGDYEAAAERITPEELKHLKERLNEFSAGFKEVKANLENSKKAREKLAHENKLAKEEMIKLNDELQKKEEQLLHANNFVANCRRKLEDAARKEVRLKEQIRELREVPTGGGAAVPDGRAAGMTAFPKNMKEAYHKARENITQLEHENQLLKAQLMALQPKHTNAQHQEMLGKQFKEYSATAERGGGGVSFTPSQLALEQQIKEGEEGKSETPSSPQRGASGGYILGTGTTAKQQLRQKLDSEDKLQKKVGILEKRLTELTTDNEDLKNQLLKTRDTLQTAQHTREEMQKKIQSSQRQAHESRKLNLHELTELETANAKIFALEDELKLVKRQAEVDQANEIRMLQHQLSSCHAKIKSLETEIIESEDQRKRLAAERISSGPSNIRSALRESEDRFMQQERLREEVDFFRRKKLELEALLVQRENTILEFRFDTESRLEEIERLRRRNAEIEIAFKTLQSIAANHAMNANNFIPSGDGGGGGRVNSILTREEERILTMPLVALVGGDQGGVLTSSTRPSSAMPAHIAASKRESELENVIDVLKKVISKFQQENDRLKRGIGVQAPAATGAASNLPPGDPARRVQELEKKFNSEKKKHETLAAEHQTTLKRNQELQEALDKANQRQTQLSNVRNQLKLKENELVLLSSEISQYKQDVEQYQRKIKTLEERIQQLQFQHEQQQLQSQQGLQPNKDTSTTSQGFGGGNTAVNKQLSQQIVENDLLRKELTELRKKLTLQTSEIMYLREQYFDKEGSAGPVGGGGTKGNMGGGAGGNRRSDDSVGGRTVDLMELNRLREENRKLKDELSAFDLEFFEEIENLKFAHAEAIRKLKQYEQQFGAIRR